MDKSQRQNGWWQHGVGLLTALLVAFCVMSSANADVPGRPVPGPSAVPNPGTQQQELPNITFPAEWNVFEFVVTCGACHGGQVDQHVAHFGNWGGSNMASAARDPIFRADQIIANNKIRQATGNDGAGNVCMRCHSPNGWLSGRFDPTLGGSAEGKTMMHSILLSTDDEGIMCETCHRAMGGVTYKREDVKVDASTGLLDKVWNMLAGLFDWQHEGNPYVDQAGDPTIAEGAPYGDTTLRFHDGMTYVGKYSGSSDTYFSDLPFAGTSYTGQIYGVYPDWWDPANRNPVPAGMPAQNSAGQYIAYNLDGTLQPVFEAPVGPPVSGTTGATNYAYQALSIEHPTVGAAGRKTSIADTSNTLLPILPEGPGSSAAGRHAGGNEYIRTPEFCGSCHDLTVPILNHGMPEQRTYTEWKFSDFSKSTHVGFDPLKRTARAAGQERCQDCHMPTLRHEFSDTDPGAYNADPLLVGGFPYGKDRNKQGGTAVHKLTGANRNLPDMMKALYPEVDLEVIGAPSGRDPRVFPGMLSDRSTMWDRAKHNTEVTLRDGINVQVTQAPTEVAGSPGIYEMKVKVENLSGHRVPSGYPDGRRFWVSVNVNNGGVPVYQSGVYDQSQATLYTDASKTGLTRALGKVIDATVQPAVMVYERVTGVCNGTTCTPSPSVLNDKILFDNRIPPKGFTYADYRLAGVKFWNYDPVTMMPFEDTTRYPDGQNWDEVTYRFAAPAGATLTAQAEVYWQTNTREHMELLRDNDTSDVRPEGPPNPFDPNYPLNPNYLSDSINGKALADITDPFKNAPLNDNWGGVAYAAWLETGMGAPFLVDRDDTTVAAPPGATSVIVTQSTEIDPVTLAVDSFAADISWTPVANADGYTLWIRYGKSDTTSDWDRLAVVGKDVTSFREYMLNPGKTYGFKVVPFNGKGDAADSNVYTYTTISAFPAAPTALTASSTAPGSTNQQITLTWMDNAVNEASFEVWRYDAVLIGQVPPVKIFGAQGQIGTQTGGPAGGAPVTGLNTWVDNDPSLTPATCYNYQVRAQNANLDMSTWSMQAQGCTVATVPTINLTATAADGYRISLVWTSNVVGVASYRISRNGAPLVSVPGTIGSYTDASALPGSTYSYQVDALSATNTVLATATATATTPAVPLAPSHVLATLNSATSITVSWVDEASNETGFVLERATVANGISSGYTPIPGIGAFLPPGAGNMSYTDTSVLPDNVYVYRLKAVNLAGSSQYAQSNTVSTFLPATPSALTAAAMAPAVPWTGNPGNPQINVAWAVNMANVTGIVLERKVGTGAFAPVAGANPLPVGALSFVDTTLPGGTKAQTVTYRIKTLNGVLTSAYFTGTGVAVAARPGQPTLKAPVLAAGPKVTLTWNNVANETGYVVERSTNGGPMSVVATLAVNVATWVDTTVVGSTSYSYQVTAVGSGGSYTSLPQNVSVPALPTTPSLLSATANGTNVALVWADVADETTYSVQRSADNEVTWSTLTSTLAANTTTYSATGQTAGLSYAFRVTANNAMGSSAPSNVLSVTMPPPAPTALAVAANGAQSLKASFVVATSATGWEIQRCVGATNAAGPCNAAGAGWANVGWGAGTGGQTFIDTGLTTGTTYNYRVRSTGANAVASAWSASRAARAR